MRDIHVYRVEYQNITLKEISLKIEIISVGCLKITKETNYYFFYYTITTLS